MFDWTALWVFLGAVAITVLFVASGWHGDDLLANRMLERLVRRERWEDSNGTDW